MKKRMLGAVLALCMLMAFVPCMASAETVAPYEGSCGENVTYSYDPDTYTLTISGTGDMYDYDNFNRVNPTPWYGTSTDNGLTVYNVIIEDGVTNIGTDAFSRKAIKSITIPNSVTSIGNNAFFRSGLTEITIPNSVTSIGNSAFLMCNSLTSITIPDSVTSVGPSCFEYCENLTSATIGSGSIGACAFKFAKNLKSVTLLDKVNNIEHGAFAYCAITDITIPNNVTEIGESAFGGCTDLASINVDENNSVYSSESGVLFNKDKTKLICCPGGKSDPYIIPNSVTEIGEGAFNNCLNFKSISIPEGVTEIGYDAFYGCSNLESVIIPNGVTEIGEGTFNSCSNLKSISIPKSITNVGIEVLDFCDNLEDVYYGGSKEDWDNITFDTYIEFQTGYISSKDDFEKATIHYNATGTKAPQITETPTVTKTADNAYTVNVKLTDVEYDSQLMTVLYDENGVLKGITITTITTDDNNTTKAVTVSADSADCAKVFIWANVGGMKPLCENKTIEKDEFVTQ